jgi:putative transcriptional regulator
MVHLNLQNLLQKNGKSKYWLVTKLDINYTVINKMIKHETTSIHFETINKLLEIFDCNIDELFTVEK